MNHEHTVKISLSEKKMLMLNLKNKIEFWRKKEKKERKKDRKSIEWTDITDTSPDYPEKACIVNGNQYFW